MTAAQRARDSARGAAGPEGRGGGAASSLLPPVDEPPPRECGRAVAVRTAAMEGARGGMGAADARTGPGADGGESLESQLEGLASYADESVSQLRSHILLLQEEADRTREAMAKLAADGQRREEAHVAAERRAYQQRRDDAAAAASLAERVAELEEQIQQLRGASGAAGGCCAPLTEILAAFGRAFCPPRSAAPATTAAPLLELDGGERSEARGL